MDAEVERALPGGPNFFVMGLRRWGRKGGFSSISLLARFLVAAGCGGFAYFLLGFAVICRGKWLIVFSGLRVR